PLPLLCYFFLMAPVTAALYPLSLHDALPICYVVTFAALGLGSTTAVSFSLVRRVREAVWVGLGLLVFSLARVGGGSVEDSPSVRDRKSTRLNSSHQIISYAVFCLKKKKKHIK